MEEGKGGKERGKGWRNGTEGENEMSGMQKGRDDGAGWRAARALLENDSG